MKDFLCENFMLDNNTASELFHDYAKKMPIFDYHCHLIPDEIAENKKFENLTQIWLKGDHYKWRVMRTNGIDEKYCTGDASDREKFQKWTETIPYALGNPVYHWTHMELKDPFGIKNKVLNADTAESVWQECNELLQTDSFKVHGLLSHFNVKAVCTTDDPIDSLESHIIIKKSSLPTKVLPTFRPDKALAIGTGKTWKEYIELLAKSADIEINSWNTLLDALKKRHDYFHDNGCRLADHGLYLPVFKEASDTELNVIMKKGLNEDIVSKEEIDQFMTGLLLYLGRLHAEKSWTMQIHLGAQRNNNTRMFKSLGPDTGFDTIADGPVALPLAKLLDCLDSDNRLPKTIIYPLNPRDNELIGTLIGCFQDGSVAGKVQFGSGWWFNDQKDGMIRQITALSQLGLLSRFIGMLTDSRSFLSYPRHEYFRRILCNMIGTWAENGEVPRDMKLLGNMVQDISFNNVQRYLGIDIE